jgi:NADH:ubiquinone oxidoreductase subunit F (NADH-binding)
MEFIPHLLIEGMITSSFALGANLSYIYIRGEYMWVYKILENHAEAKAAGWLEKYIRNRIRFRTICSLLVLELIFVVKKPHIDHWKEKRKSS